MPVPFLPLLDGFGCNLCLFNTINRKVIRIHLNQTHLLKRHACDGSFTPVQLQSWYAEKRAKYWRVQTATGTATAAATVTPPTVYKTAANILKQLEEEECSRLEQLAQDHLVADAKVEAEEISPWLNVTEWPTQFAQRPVDLISRYALLRPMAVVVASGENAYLGSF